MKQTMIMRETMINENLEHIDKFCGDNFTPDKYVNEALFGKSFAFANKSKTLNDVKAIAQSTDEFHNTTSEKFVDILLNNYESFINIGKYVERIDKSISQVTSAQKNYSSLIDNLRRDVEEFAFGYSTFMKDTIDDNKTFEDNKNQNIYTFNLIENDEQNINEFNMEQFLNPKPGDKKWLEEQPEKLRVLINDKKYDECIKLIQQIRKVNLYNVDYDIKIEIDNAYNYLIEKLTLSIGRCVHLKEVKYYLDKMKVLGCVGLCMDTFLNWLSKKLRTKVQKLIHGDVISSDKRKQVKKELNVIGEENDNESDNDKQIESNMKAVSNCMSGSKVEKIIEIISTYFDLYEKYLKEMNEYINIKNDKTYCLFILPWLRQEMNTLNKQIEPLFIQIKTPNELEYLMKYLSTLFNKYETLGKSNRFLYEMHFLNNLKTSLNTIINYINGKYPDDASYDIRDYDFEYNGKDIILRSSIYDSDTLLEELKKYI